MNPSCPKCGKYFTKRVPMQGADDPLSTVSGMYAYRCQLCAELFRAKKTDPQAAAAPQTAASAALTNVTNRQYVRVAAKFPVAFAVNKIQQDAMVTEIALGGCTLEANVVLAIGAKFRMDIIISNDEPPLVVSQAIVRSVRPTGFGIQFLEITDAEKERLGRLLEKLLTTMLG